MQSAYSSVYISHSVCKSTVCTHTTVNIYSLITECVVLEYAVFSNSHKMFKFPNLFETDINLLVTLNWLVISASVLVSFNPVLQRSKRISMI